MIEAPYKWIWITATLSGALAVALGAFGAHALREMLQQSNRLETWQTAVQYQFWHTLALMLIALLGQQTHLPVQSGALAITAGTVIFSGSLYLLCLSGLKWLGAITPIGGVLLILGWLLILLAIFQQ
jgi:uncharacterized membrane protein YgdD (TMEM256/DUF423 family)